MRKILLIFLCLLTIGCQNKTEPKKVEAKTYSQSFKSDIAWIVLEWNGKVFGYGSGFLIDKEKGAFYTNRHVSEMFNSLGQGSHKIFFNGKVYNASIIKALPLVDAALIKITDKFEPSEFPEPSPVFNKNLDIGDEVFMEGFHPHPEWVRSIDEEQGFKYDLIPIYKDYYKVTKRQSPQGQEVLDEKLTGKVVRLDVTAKEVIEKCGGNINGQGLAEYLQNKTNLYIQVQINKDHRFSFGGMSGSAVKNSKGEIVGITTMQDVCRADYNPDDIEKFGFAIGKQIFDTVYLTPIESVEKLRNELSH